MAPQSKSLRAGDVLFAQGERPAELHVVESGSFEVLVMLDDFEGLDRSIVLSKSVRAAVIEGKSIMGGFSDKLSAPYQVSARALADSQVSVYPLKSDGIRGTAAGDPSLTINLLRNLYSRAKNYTAGLGRYARLFRTLNMINDNMGILYMSAAGSNAPASLHNMAEKLESAFNAGGGLLPDGASAQFLVTDNGALLKKDYAFPRDVGDMPVFKPEDLVVKYLQLDPAVVAPVFKADPSMAETIYESLYAGYVKSLHWAASLGVALDMELDMLLGGGESWANYLVDRRGMDSLSMSGKISPDFEKSLLSLLVKINSLYEELYGVKITGRYPGVKKIHAHYTAKKDEPVNPEASLAAGGARPKAGPAVISSGILARSIQQILEYAVADKESQTKLLKLLAEFKGLKNPFGTETDGVKCRRFLSKSYWELYKQVYIRHLSEPAMPKPAELMLQFGFLDEGLLEPNQLPELIELSKVREKPRDVPVLYEPEFLKLVYEGQEEPSVNEMGLTYRAFQLELEKNRSRKDAPTEKIDEKLKILMYEIDQRLTFTVAVCAGSRDKAFPILTSDLVHGTLNNYYVSKRKIEAIINEIKSIDYSLFFRETVLKLGGARELIYEEVLPYIMLLPSFGTRTLLWQDLSGINRRSHGRIVVPIMFMGDLKRNLVHSLACFRWELNKTIKGGGWADPIEGGITGEFFDYQNNYKKLSKLSPEMKEKIAERFKSFRTTRDRFADDYIQWVMYEKDGIMKQNSVVREMFFKHIPFSREIRDRLEGMPAFAHSANRYKNIQKKTIEAAERRFKKYQDAGGNYPPEIQQYIEYLNK